MYFALSRVSEGVTGHVAPPDNAEFDVLSISDSFQVIRDVLGGPKSKNHQIFRKSQLLFWSGFFYLGYHCSKTETSERCPPKFSRTEILNDRGDFLENMERDTKHRWRVQEEIRFFF